MTLNVLFLIRKSPGIGILRVDDRSQHFFACLADLFEFGGSPKTYKLVRVIAKVEKLRLKADVIDELLIAISDHERAGYGAARMILRKHHAVRCVAICNAKQGCAR